MGLVLRNIRSCSGLCRGASGGRFGQVRQQVFRGLADLPITVLERGGQRGVDLWPVERGQRQDRSPPHGRLVGAARQDGGKPAGVADGAERGDRCLAHQHLGAVGGESAQFVEHVVGYLYVLASSPGGNLDDRRVRVAEQRQQRDVRPGGGQQSGAVANCRFVVGQCRLQVAVGERAHAVECAERELAGDRVTGGEAGAGGEFVALVTGHHEVPPLLVGTHCFSMSVRVMMIHAVPNAMTVAAMAPTHTASTLLATTDHKRRHHRVRTAGGALTSATSSPLVALNGRRARAGSAVALAGLRQPAAISATMASPAIQPAAVVTSVMFTQVEMVPEPNGEGRAPSGRHRWWAIPLAALGIVVAASPLVLSFVPSTVFVEKTRCTEYGPQGECVTEVQEPVEFAIVPANAEVVGPLLAVTGAPTYPNSGDVYFVTITEPDISMLDWFVTRDNDATRFRSYIDKYGDRTPQQIQQAGQQQMRSAKDNAVYVALKAAGYPVEIVPGDVIIDFLLCLEANEAGTECIEFSPADVLLDPGDVLKKVDGKPVTIIDDLAPILAEVEAGEMIEIEFERDGVAMKGEIETINAPGEDPPRTIVGFRPIDTTTVVLPEGLQVDLATGEIGGPSAGLAFTLELIDALTEGDLMGGKKVGVTGTIDISGNVGAIGGLNSKASAVKQVGVDYFLVPLNQGEDGVDGIARAREVVGPDIEVIPVATLEEALAELVRIGGDPVELVDLTEA